MGHPMASPQIRIGLICRNTLSIDRQKEVLPCWLRTLGQQSSGRRNPAPGCGQPWNSDGNDHSRADVNILLIYNICYNTFLTLYRLSALPLFDIYQSGSMTPCQQISYPFGILSLESGLPSVQRNNETTPQSGWLLPLRPSWPDKCWNHIPVIYSDLRFALWIPRGTTMKTNETKWLQS